MSLWHGLVNLFTHTLREKQTDELFRPFAIKFPAYESPIRIHSVTLAIAPLSRPIQLEGYFRRILSLPAYNWNGQEYILSNGFAAGLELNYNFRWLSGDWESSYSLGTSRVAWRDRWLPTNEDRRHH